MRAEGKPRDRLAIVTGVLLCIGAVLIAASFVDPRLERVRGLLLGPSDGEWRMTHVDGMPVDRTYLITLERGRIVGGYDGCSKWASNGERTPDGERLATFTLQPCPSHRFDPVYRATIAADPAWPASVHRHITFMIDGRELVFSLMRDG